jgi:uncharacterized protein YcbK (DUF882 family)
MKAPTMIYAFCKRVDRNDRGHDGVSSKTTDVGRKKLLGKITLAVALSVGLALPSIDFAAADSLRNPWSAVAPQLFNDEEQFYEPNEFDAMTMTELAAVPAGKRIKWIAPANCVPGSLKSVLNQVAARFGPITVNSTARSRAKNRKVGGRSKSYHLGCRAVDFRVHGSNKGVMRFLAANGKVGGLKRYRSGFYHIDNGPRRSW